MKRVIKFRGMMTTGEWVYGLPSHDLPGSTAYYNECSYRISWEPESGGRANAPIKNGTLGQFTGLKDRDGNEIYEGDIINDDNPEESNNGKVVWDKDHWAIEWGKNELDYFADYHMDGFIVVGNIYQNSKLIP